MRKKLAAGGLVILGVLALGIGGTYSSFSSTKQGPKTLAKAQTLDLQFSTEDGASVAPLRLENLKPGDESHYFVRLINKGTIPGRANWGFESHQELENGCNQAEKAAGDNDCGSGSREGELGEQLGVTLSLMPGSSCAGKPKVVGPRYFPSSDDRKFQDLNGLVLGPNESRCVRVDIRFPDLPENNEVQSDSSIFGFRFQLVQLSS